ncbi:hypothetical protein LP420_17185 [Massilia sp. B-10]|nr:hypothetical protein LP420_17185 [Massilia sp. B-10]
MKKFQKFLFADLDDTLFQSREKCGPGDVLQPAAFLKDGSPISYTTEGQRAFLAFAQDGMTMIPATARNLNAFQRVDLPFDSWAVLDYGGIVLQPGGVLDQHWLDHMRAAMQAALPGLRELAALIDAWAERTGFASRAPDRRLRHAVLPGRQGRRQDRRAPRTDRARGGGAVDRRRRARLLHSPQRQQPGDPAECPEQVARGGLCHAAAAREQHGDILTFGIGDSRSDAASWPPATTRSSRGYPAGLRLTVGAL